MKILYYTNYSITEPKECLGVIKIIESNERKKTHGLLGNREGYYRKNGEWIRDDWKAYDKAFGENLDWFEADEKEAKKAIWELDEAWRRRQKNLEKE